MARFMHAASNMRQLFASKCRETGRPRS